MHKKTIAKKCLPNVSATLTAKYLLAKKHITYGHTWLILSKSARADLLQQIGSSPLICSAGQIGAS